MWWLISQWPGEEEKYFKEKNENSERNKASVTQANEAMGEQPPLLISKIC